MLAEALALPACVGGALGGGELSAAAWEEGCALREREGGDLACDGGREDVGALFGAGAEGHAAALPRGELLEAELTQHEVARGEAQGHAAAMQRVEAEGVTGSRGFAARRAAMLVAARAEVGRTHERASKRA